MSEMVDRAALAVVAELLRQGEQDEGPYTNPEKASTTRMLVDGDVDPSAIGRAVIEALRAAGYVIAPRVPTEAMKGAADAAMRHAFYWGYEVRDESDSGAVIWRAMGGAAPKD